MKIYISGKITGLDEEIANDLFKAVETKLIQLGHEAINPMTLLHEHDETWESFMKVDLKAMMDCDAIIMLDNWTKSKGAKIELDLALKLGLKPMFENDI
jgi:nucleoside 2-deoxyribosyltransferase